MARRKNAHPELTARDLEVLQLAADGYEASEIAEKLHVSAGTISHRRSRILAKLKARNTTHAVAIYCRSIAPRGDDNPANALNNAKL